MIVRTKRRGVGVVYDDRGRFLGRVTALRGVGWQAWGPFGDFVGYGQTRGQAALLFKIGDHMDVASVTVDETGGKMTVTFTDGHQATIGIEEGRRIARDPAEARRFMIRNTRRRAVKKADDR